MSVMGLEGHGALWAQALGVIAADKQMHKCKKNRVIAVEVIM